MSDREEPCDPEVLPPSMAVDLAGYAWARVIVGESGGAVYRLHGKHGAPDLFLKHGRGAIAGDSTDEMVRLRWLARYVSVPRILQFAGTADDAWLLTTAMPGRTAYQILSDAPARPIAIVDALANFLRQLHAIPADACPFNSNHAFRLSQARTRVEAGLVDVDDFDEEREGWTAEQVWDALHGFLPFAPDLVVTHGDFSLDNLLIEGDAVTGCIDIGRVGVADRYQDLAILWNCLGEFDTALQARFVARYGIGELDRGKLDFHLLLDEFF